MEKESRRNKIYAVIAIGVLLLLLIGSTFAYFAAQGTDASQTDVNVLTHTVDSLVFETGDAISITADQNTFAQGKGNQTDSTFARATLKANSSTNQATDHYYVYLSIDENTFEYTTTEKTAELILTVNKVEGETKTLVTTIDGLNYVTVGSVSGFDITEVNDLITIANNYEITSTGTKIDEWEVILTLVNLDSNQNANAGKVFNGTLMIQKEGTLTSYIKSLYTTQGANGLYYHDSTLSGGAGDNSYRYSAVLLGLDEFDENLFRVIHLKDLNVHAGDTNIDGDIDIIVKKELLTSVNLEGYTDNQFRDILVTSITKKNNNEELTEEEQIILILFVLSQYNSKEEAMMDAYTNGDTDKVSELSINNYVCFGSDETTCPEDNLYRIIGVFDDKVKLIKNKSIGQMAWDKEGTAADWSTSSLQSYLNNEFLNTLGDYSKLVALNSWNISDFIIDQYNEKKASDVFRVENAQIKTYDAKIGLMYASDYAYSNNIEGWNSTVSDPDTFFITPVSFLNIDKSEWLINKQPDSGYAVGTDGHFVNIWSVGGIEISSEVRPSFYLKSSVMYDSGTGTPSDPYRIN